MLQIFLTLAIGFSTCKRSFSKLKVRKNYFRCIMSSLKIKNLAILSIERQLTDEIDFDNVIDNYAKRKARKLFLETDNNFALIKTEKIINELFLFF